MKIDNSQDMAKQKGAERAILFCAVLFREEALYRKILQMLKKRWGELLVVSPIFPFRYTDYYKEEMGDSLKKVFVLFSRFVPPEQIDSLKRWTTNIEKRYSVCGKRRVNLDPGYMTLSKLVLASTKNYYHRIYIRKGIYAEVTLCYRKDSYEGFEWGYPDYKDTNSVDFFNKARVLLKKKIEEAT